MVLKIEVVKLKSFQTGKGVMVKMTKDELRQAYSQACPQINGNTQVVQNWIRSMPQLLSFMHNKIQKFSDFAAYDSYGRVLITFYLPRVC